MSGAPDWAALREPLGELAPLLRRSQQLEPAGLARLHGRAATLVLFVRLPFGVLASRGVPADGTDALDVTVGASDLLRWLDTAAGPEPERRDAQWRGGLPPAAGWRRVETVPDDVLRPLVRAGALALKEAAVREGVPGAQPRAEVADALLDSVVLTVADEAGRVEVTLRTLSALTRLGFLARDSQAHVDVAGRWTRVAGVYGSVYAESGGGLQLR